MVTGSFLLLKLKAFYDYINRYNRTHSKFKDILITDIRNCPVNAIREALFNSVMSRDYAVSNNILTFDNRIEMIFYWRTS